MNTLSNVEWIKMGIDAGILPATLTFDAPGKLGGTITIATIDTALVAAPIYKHGTKQKFGEKVANPKAAATLHTPELLTNHFISLFKQGIWNERPGGGPRVDAKEAFIRMQALREAKIAHKKVGGKMDNVDAIEALMRIYSQDPGRRVRYEQAWEILNPEE